MLLKSVITFALSLLVSYGAFAYNVGTSYPDKTSVIYEGFYDEVYTCKKVPQIKTVCGFERECERRFLDCRDVPYCVKVGTWTQQCGTEYVHKLRPVPGQ